MRPFFKSFVPLLAASLTLGACGSSSSNSGSYTHASSPATTSTSPSGSTALVKTASNPTFGTVLVNAQGMTLYHLSAEKSGKFICTSSSCVGIWHPVIATSATPSATVASLGTVKRPDGTMQVTYKGEPLYTFAQDQHPGETKGQGFKDVGTWTVVTTTAKASTSAPAATTPATTQTETSPPSESGGSSGGGYGY